MKPGDIDSHNLPGKKINYGRQVDKPSLKADVGKVRTPDLVGFYQLLLFQYGLDQIGNAGWGFTPVLLFHPGLMPSSVRLQAVLPHYPSDPVMAHLKIQRDPFMTVVLMVYHDGFNLAFQLPVGLLPFSLVVETGTADSQVPGQLGLVDSECQRADHVNLFSPVLSQKSSPR